MNGPVRIQVAVDVPLAGTFSYLTESSVMPGSRVSVPFGNRRVCGVVVTPIPGEGVAEVDAAKLRRIDGVLDGLPPLPDDFLALARFASDYYHHPLGQTLFTALPTGLREPRDVSRPDRRPFALTAAGLAEPPPARQRARLALWQALQDGPLDLAAAKAVTPQAGKLLADWLAEGKAERATPERPPLRLGDAPALNDEQQAALDALLASEGFQPWLLHGVTGSGKTEVYLRLIAEQLAARAQTLVLVPEINLTPQLINRFADRFPDSRIVVQHSHLADGERLHGWLDAWHGDADVVIGTRLSVFTPLPRLGLIVVDEEHDGSFKQQDGLRYHARDLAVWRARRAGVAIVLGSATPSLETVANVEAGRYKRLTLSRRAHGAARLPEVRLVDTRRKKLAEGLSEPVLEALQARLARKEMSLVFINRRGFAPVVACSACGWTSGCPHCSAKLVVHLMERKLRCHHCGWEEPVPRACPDCGDPDIKPLGEGTQRLESALQRMLPDARVLRIDRDTTSRKDAWDEVYRKVHGGEVDILVGTQMLAKGHDFGTLSLVAALGADGGLYSADFRASERLFAQLMQVAGRAGRADAPGEVLVQTQWPDHPLYQALVAHDFDGYAATLLTERRQAGFPPSTFQALLRADSPELARATAFLRQARETLEPLAEGVLISGPAPALMARLAQRERAQLVLESPQRGALHRLLDSLPPMLDGLAKAHGRALRWSLDVDPQEL
ncbi:primosomal protein N' [Chromobacterium violaceum]|uniref:Replication restart protein PriA n=1 Tax=Chromobacterium violaceum (strain ATCC 12472 / DSM 30191 / JCM 1249 / CCUG 213 / NBRC 12614 / NCIMB 9131 / NCTC 9757 / MK) TaxID=243365 RepID=Q7NYZ8_CHRVO|nr:primosomal protein N' [Chromobacterium violaceum]AAQ58799.1 primosomal protein N` [Chromobacterium violaceum ATCC 12472]SUX89021.1 Primosomal protein N' [Chromobacterium violaceum]